MISFASIEGFLAQWMENRMRADVEEWREGDPT